MRVMSNPNSNTNNRDAKSRLDALRKLLDEGSLSTQDELREKLEKMDFAVTQSTISRDLRKIGAVKAIDPSGRTVYRLPDDNSAPVAAASALRDHVLDIRTNGAIIAIRTSPGSASLLARHIDYALSKEIIGTLAGDDTIFVAPASIREIRQTIEAIERSLSPEGQDQ